MIRQLNRTWREWQKHLKLAMLPSMVKSLRTLVLLLLINYVSPLHAERPHDANPPLGILASTSSSSREMIDPNTLVFYALKTAIAGPPVACKVHQQTVAFNQQVIMSGEYKSMGNWSGQFRNSSRLSAGDTTLDTIQVSDGRLMYTQFSTNSPKLVNVEKVREQLIPRLYRPEENPDIYLTLAIGGQAELLRNLYQRYHWYRVVEGRIGGVDVWQLFGKLRTEPPKLVGMAKVDKQIIEMNTELENLPSNVRLTLGRPTDPQPNGTTFAYFPYLIEYFRLQKDKYGRVRGLAPVSKIEYLEPTHNFKVNETDFIYRVEPTTERIEEETSLYLTVPQ